MTNSQLWPTYVESETQQIPPMPPAKDGTPRDEWLGGVHPDGQLQVTNGFHLQADPSRDEAAAPIAQGLRKWLPFRDISSPRSLMESRVGPMAQAVLAVRARDLRWGILTGGARWRLVDAWELRRYEHTVEVDLDALARSHDPASLRLFPALFHRVSRLTNEGFRVHSSKEQV